MRATLYLLAVVMFFSGNLLVGKTATGSLPPFALATARMGVAFIAATCCFGVASWRWRYRLISQWRALAIMAVMGMALFQALIYAALATTSANSVAVLETGIPVATAVVMALIFKERLRGTQWAGVLLSVVGAIWVVTKGEPAQALDNASAGSAIMVLAIACWVIYSLAVRHWWATLPIYASLPPMTAIGVLVLLPLAWVEYWMLEPTLSLDSATLGAVVYLGLGPSLVAFVCYNRAVALVGPSRASLALNLLPVATMLLGYAVFGYGVTSAQIIGSVMTITGVCLVIAPRFGPARERQ
ncbi:DMT family transporter [Vreelandella sp. EE22]